MSLQVWLPLNGDLRNQGLKNMTVTDGEATIDDNGKIGKCYRFGTAKSFLELPAEAMNDFTTECTVSFWLKILTRNTSWATYFQAGLGGTPCNNYVFGFLRNGSGNKCCFTVSGEAGTSSGSFVTSDMELDTWYHITLVYQTGHCLIYMDGMLYHDYPTEIVPAFNNITTITIGCANTKTNYQSNCLLNDLRIYDHALSPREVKHLAQGLVLHYPLSDPYIESTTNLITTEDCLSSTCFNAATTKYGYGANTDIYKTVTTYDGRKGTKVYMGTNGNSCYPYVYVSDMFTSDGSNAPAYKTLSFDYYGTIGNYLGPYKLGSGEGTATYTVTCQGIKTTGTYSNSGGFTVTPNKWNHVEITFHGTTAANSQWGYIRIGNGNHTSNTSNFWFFANMQLEAKDHATGYAGVGGTRTSATVYDTSGFCNNGTINGSLTISNDTPRYNASTVFDGNQYIVEPNEIITTDSTIALWVKSSLNGNAHVLDARNNSGIGKQPIYQYTSGAIQTGGNAGYVGSNSGLLVADTWVHVVLVQNGNSLFIYKNGDLFQIISCENSPVIKPTLGARYTFTNKYTGQLSDFRIYATALSLEDVRDLYSVAASISDSGTLMASEVSEL